MRTSTLFIFWSCTTIGLSLAAARDIMGTPAPRATARTDPSHVSSTTSPNATSSDSSPERIKRLIHQLGDADFAVRQEAQAELAKLGFVAYEALEAAQHDTDLEIAARARYLLRLMRADLTRPGDPPEVASLLADFRFLQEHEQIARLQKLASLGDGRGIPALCRVIRFEPSMVLAKQAAVAILKRYPSEQVTMDRLAKLLRTHLQHGRRLPSRWLLSYAKFHDAPREAWQEWEKWTKQEQHLLKQKDQDTSASVVSALVTRQIDWVLKMGGDWQQMVDRIQTMFQLRRRSGKDAKPLIEWLVKQKAWEVLGMTPSAFADRLTRHPRSLVYDLAKTYADTDKNALAEAAAERAFRFEDGHPEQRPRLHYMAAFELQRQGRFPWAEREYRRVIASGKPSDQFVLGACIALGEMLHDQAEDLRAAEVIEPLLETVKGKGKSPIAGVQIKSLMARMDYFLACHWKAKGDLQKQRLYLDAGLAIDPTSIDLLIACYHLPDTDPVYREKVRELITKASLQLRTRVLTGPDRTSACNQLAWLVSNTEGDFDEAIRLSRRSLRDEPDNGGYYDTLARCYFAKGDYENAVKYQIKAVELEPHSGQIAKQLELFRETYQQKTGKPAPKPTPRKKPAEHATLREHSIGDSTELELEDVIPLP